MAVRVGEEPALHSVRPAHRLPAGAGWSCRQGESVCATPPHRLSYHPAVPDAPDVSVGWAMVVPSPPREWSFIFWLHDKGKVQQIEPRAVEREGDRFFIVTLPGGEVRRWRQQGLAIELVESIPGGDPE